VSVLSVILALVGAVLFAFGTVLQQKGTMEEPAGEALKAGFLLRLLRKPVWLLGVGIDALGYACQAAALGVGKLVVVQPLLVSSVVFALPIGARLTGQRVGRREIAGALAVVVGLAAFTLVSNPEGGVDNASDRGWLIGAAVTGGVALALVLASRGTKSAGARAALIGTASGVLFGYIAALTKATVDQLDDGIVAVLTDWHLYGLIGTSVIAFALMQAALATGALAPALSTVMVFETLVGVAAGIWMLDEQLHEETWGIVVSSLSLAIVVVGLILLARSQGALEEGSKPAEGEAEAVPVTTSP
jgi:drug/metabolite transporter (DMT)-like permease